MSLAVKTARAEAMGDPGLFGAIGGFVKGAIGGLASGSPLGVLGGAISGAVAGGRSKPRGRAARPGGVLVSPVMPGVGRRRNIQQQQRNLPVLRKGGLRGSLERLVPGGATGFEVAPQDLGPNGAPRGMRLNKSDYFLRDGTFVPAGTRWVKSRRRNPANARATSRAIARVGSAKKLQADLNRITIRPKKCK